MEKVAVLAPGEVVRLEDLSEEIASVSSCATAGIQPDLEPDDIEELSLSAIEKRHIERVLLLCDYNKSEAARRLGISREGLRKKMARYGIAV